MNLLIKTIILFMVVFVASVNIKGQIVGEPKLDAPAIWEKIAEDRKRGAIVMPVTEIISKNEFFDYEAKYTLGKSDEVTPANITDEITAEIQEQLYSMVIEDLFI